MSVFYKFKSSNDGGKITFDGLHISIGEIKKSILQQKEIGKSNDFDLQIKNAQTDEVYTSDDTLIQKNTTVIVARAPANLLSNKKQWKEVEHTLNLNDNAHISLDKILTSSDLSKFETEEEKLKAIMNQSTQDYDSSKFIKTRPMTGPVPSHYICKRCNKPGHFVNKCPLNSQVDVRRSTGIPRSFMMPAKADQRGALITSSGEYVVPIIDHEAYKERKKERPPFVPNENLELDNKLIEEIPDELQCPLCKSLLQDAVMIPCCSVSYCDECIRTHLLDSEDHKCPACSTVDVSPDTLLPNRYLRSKVLRYKNEQINYFNNKANQSYSNSPNNDYQTTSTVVVATNALKVPSTTVENNNNLNRSPVKSPTTNELSNVDNKIQDEEEKEEEKVPNDDDHHQANEPINESTTTTDKLNDEKEEKEVQTQATAIESNDDKQISTDDDAQSNNDNINDNTNNESKLTEVFNKEQQQQQPQQSIDQKSNNKRLESNFMLKLLLMNLKSKYKFKPTTLSLSQYILLHSFSQLVCVNIEYLI